MSYLKEAIESMNRNEETAEDILLEAIVRLKEITYARGYKDGFNDGKDANYLNKLIHGAGKDAG